MKLVFKKSFHRDLKKISNKDVLSTVAKTIHGARKASQMKEIQGIKKLSAYKTYYRVKIKDYRIGINYDGLDFYFVRILHRRDFYKYFP